MTRRGGEPPGSWSDWLESNMQDPTASAAIARADGEPKSEPQVSAWRRVLEAVRHGSFEQQAEFWDALREGVPPVADETETDIDRRARLRAAAPATTAATIYYVRFADRVKIGYTQNLEKRLRNLPHDEVLATEPGTLQDERARHDAFADLRVTGEWFRYEEPLRSHIAGLQ